MKKEVEETRRKDTVGYSSTREKSPPPFSAKGRTAGIPDLLIAEKAMEIKAHLQKHSLRAWKV